MSDATFAFFIPDPVGTPPVRVCLEHCHLRKASFTITPALYFLVSASCHQQAFDKIGRHHRS
jgi:hypothetical protein